jgi:hypothetical protein
VGQLAGRYTHEQWHRSTFGEGRDGDELAKLAEADEIQVLRLTNSLAGEGGDTLVVRSELLAWLEELISSAGGSYWCLVERLADELMDGRSRSGDEAILLLKDAERNHGITSLASTW